MLDGVQVFKSLSGPGSRARHTLAASLLVAGLGPLLVAARCDTVTAPPGDEGVLGRARFTHSLEGPLGATPLAAGTRFVISANRDGCDRLEEVCDDPLGELLVYSSNDEVLNIAPRADGLLGAFAGRPGTVTLFAIDGDDVVQDILPVEVASAVTPALTDQPEEARGPRAVPSMFSVRAGEQVDLRLVLADGDGRVLLTGSRDDSVWVEQRDTVSPLVDPILDLLELQDRVRVVPGSGAVGETGRVVLDGVGADVDGAVYRLRVDPPTGPGALRIELMDVRSEPGFGVVAVELCVERLFEGRLQLGGGYRWTAPAGFAVRNAGVGALADEPPAASRCVVALRYDDREVDPSERFIVESGPLRSELPFGVAAQRVAVAPPWYGVIYARIVDGITRTTAPDR